MPAGTDAHFRYGQAARLMGAGYAAAAAPAAATRKPERLGRTCRSGMNSMALPAFHPRKFPNPWDA